MSVTSSGNVSRDSVPKTRSDTSSGNVLRDLVPKTRSDTASGNVFRDPVPKTRSDTSSGNVFPDSVPKTRSDTSSGNVWNHFVTYVATARRKRAAPSSSASALTVAAQLRCRWAAVPLELQPSGHPTVSLRRGRSCLIAHGTLLSTVCFGLDAGPYRLRRPASRHPSHPALIFVPYRIFGHDLPRLS